MKILKRLGLTGLLLLHSTIDCSTTSLSNIYAKENINEKLNILTQSPFKDKLKIYGPFLYHSRGPPTTQIDHPAGIGRINLELGGDNLSVFYWYSGKYNGNNISFAIEYVNGNKRSTSNYDNIGIYHMSDKIAEIILNEESNIKKKLDEIMDPIWEKAIPIAYSIGNGRTINLYKLDISKNSLTIYTNQIGQILQEYFNSNSFNQVLKQNGIYIE